MTWLWSPGRAATLHRRLRTACKLASLVPGAGRRPRDRHPPKPAGSAYRPGARRSALARDGIAELARECIRGRPRARPPDRYRPAGWPRPPRAQAWRRSSTRSVRSRTPLGGCTGSPNGGPCWPSPAKSRARSAWRNASPPWKPPSVSWPLARLGSDSRPRRVRPGEAVPPVNARL